MRRFWSLKGRECRGRRGRGSCLPLMMVAYSSRARMIVGDGSTNHSRLRLFFFFFFKWRQFARTISTLLGQRWVHSGSASWDDCGRAFPDDLCVGPFCWWVPTLSLNNMVSPLRFSLDQRLYACLAVAYHLYVWQNERGPLLATTVLKVRNSAARLVLRVSKTDHMSPHLAFLR